MGDEAAMADSGRKGKVVAGVGRVAHLAFLNNLLSPRSVSGPEIRSVVPCASDWVRLPFQNDFPGGGEGKGTDTRLSLRYVMA